MHITIRYELIQAIKDFRSKDKRYLKLLIGQKILICKEVSGWGFGLHESNKTQFGFCPMSYLKKME